MRVAVAGDPVALRAFAEDDPRPRPDLHRPGGARSGQVGRYADVWSRHRQRRQNYLIQQQLTDTDSD